MEILIHFDRSIYNYPNSNYWDLDILSFDFDNNKYKRGTILKDKNGIKYKICRIYSERNYLLYILINKIREDGTSYIDDNSENLYMVDLIEGKFTFESNE